jgi:hypothetical protein
MTNEDHNWVKVLRSKRRILGVAENSARQVANICSDYLASAFDTTINDVGFATL